MKIRYVGGKPVTMEGRGLLTPGDVFDVPKAEGDVHVLRPDFEAVTATKKTAKAADKGDD